MTAPIRAAWTTAALVALAGTAQAGVVSWAAAVDGEWTDGINWSSMSIPTVADDVEIGLSGTYTVSVLGPQQVSSLTIANPDAALNIRSAHSVWANSAGPVSTIVNDGTVLVNSNVSFSPSGIYAGSATSQGSIVSGPNQSGVIILNISDSNNDLSDAQVDITNGGAHGPDHTIRGKGIVTGDFDNQGLINADRLGQELRVTAQLTQSGSGELRASNGGILGLGSGATVDGGPLVAEAGDDVSEIRVTTGTANITGGATLSGAAGVNPNCTLAVGPGGFINNGVIAVNTFSNTSFAQVLMTANTTIGGSGSVHLNNSDSNNDLSDATLATDAGITGTIATNQTVTGKGQVVGTWINDGVILATQAGQELRVQASVTQSAGGMLSATNGAVLGLAGGSLITGGLFSTDSGGRVTATQGISTIDAVHNTGDLTVDNGRSLLINSGGLVNDGDITINTQQGVNTAELQFNESGAITGTGTIDLNVGDPNGDLADAQVNTGAGATGTIGAGQTITGKGRVQGTIALLGVIDADRPGQEIRVGGTLDATGGGVVSASNGGTAYFESCTVTNATLSTQSGGLVAVQSDNSVFAGVTNLGDAGTRSGATLTSTTDLVNHGLFTLNIQQGVNRGELVFTTDGTGLRGSGEARLNVSDSNSDLADARLTAADGITALNASSHTITGKGQVIGSWDNNGTINADRPGQTLETQGTIDQSANGQLRADDGVLLMTNTHVEGGSFDSSGTGAVRFAGNTSSMESVINTADAGVLSGGNVLLGAAGFTNNGLFTLNANAGVNNATLIADADSAIDGTGQIALAVADPNSDYADATLGAAEGAALTVGAGQSLTGKGRLLGRVDIEGTVAPGNNPSGDEIDAIIIRANGTSEGVTLAAASEYAVEAAAEEVNDALSSTVPVTLDGGTLRFTPINGFEPPRPTRYTIITAPEITGTFGTLIYEGVVPEGGVFRVVYEDEEVIAAVTCAADIAAPIGILDLNDITFFTQLFLKGSLLVDLNEDGLLDLSDIGLFVQEFLAGCG